MPDMYSNTFDYYFFVSSCLLKICESFIYFSTFSNSLVSFIWFVWICAWLWYLLKLLSKFTTIFSSKDTDYSWVCSFYSTISSMQTMESSVYWFPVYNISSSVIFVRLLEANWDIDFCLLRLIILSMLSIWLCKPFSSSKS